MDNFEILVNVSYWMDCGDFEVVVRYMNQLQGEVRKVVGDWLKEVKFLLEIR